MRWFIAFCVLPLLPAVALAWTHGSPVAPPPATFDGLVGTRGTVPTDNSGDTQAMTRLASFARAPVTKMKIVTPNWFGQQGGGSNGESAPGSTAVVKASIEYPAGVCTPLTWSSASSATISNGGQVTSDYVNVSIPANAQFWIREYITASAGVVWDSFQGQVLALGDALVVGNSGVVDQTSSCTTVTDGGTFRSIAPLAIIAPIAVPAVCLLGDSIQLGVAFQHAPNSVGDSGIVAPSIGPSFGYSNMGVNGESAVDFVGTHTNRAAILQYCSHTIVEYGTNDLYLSGQSVAQLEASLTTIYGLATGQTVFQNTLIARTCSTDGWATTGNQTAYTGGSACSTATNFEALRVSFNTALTGATFGPNGGDFDPTGVVGTGANNSLWNITCAPTTNDGVHPDHCGYYSLVQGSGYIDLSRITLNLFIADLSNVILTNDSGTNNL